MRKCVTLWKPWRRAVQEAETGTVGEGRIEVMNYEGNISEIGKKLVRAANLNKNLTSSIPPTEESQLWVTGRKHSDA